MCIDVKQITEGSFEIQDSQFST